MLRVMLIRDGEGRVAELRNTLEQGGVQIVAEVLPAADLSALIARHAPDVVLIDTDAPSRDTLEGVCVASAHGDRPVVMFTESNDRQTMRAALQAGVAAYVVGEVPASRIRSLLDVAIERYAVDRARREELTEARQRLAERQWVEKAKGLLMSLRGVSEEEAYRMLREHAMKSQRRIGEVARAMVEAAGWLKS
ncbi:ANTAR domain-containing response regulator [Bordetella bronchialis]|uniref:Histidine kinase n=1 Tax=Bordetella bronchialis TaxID=463025 RepID=A0A193FVA8_9BORD|nr:ANTAR domain-containing protein [Bordetella bronchialis]ANN66032.1 histidine kinase [Bordetella bronchialis]ANN71116.1 histidine kinase [Bordetella bronchialis]